jgi:DNA-directed RNA polymerase subunit RPC12/RpoP
MKREMGDLISRKALIQDIEDTIKFSGCVNHEGEIMDCVRYEPSEDAEIVKHARWVTNTDDFTPKKRCTNCGYNKNIIAGENIEQEPENFCLNCGAKMDLK